MNRKLARRAIPFAWVLIAAEAALATRKHFERVDPGTRRRVVQLVAKSKGRRKNLTTREQLELRKLVRKLQLMRLGRDLAVVASPLRGKKR